MQHVHQLIAAVGLDDHEPVGARPKGIDLRRQAEEALRDVLEVPDVEVLIVQRRPGVERRLQKAGQHLLAEARQIRTADVKRAIEFIARRTNRVSSEE